LDRIPRQYPFLRTKVYLLYPHLALAHVPEAVGLREWGRRPLLHVAALQGFRFRVCSKFKVLTDLQAFSWINLRKREIVVVVRDPGREGGGVGGGGNRM